MRRTPVPTYGGTMRDTLTAQAPNPAGLSVQQQDRAQHEAAFAGSMEAHLALQLHRHATILDRIAATLDALVPRDVPAIVRTVIVTASANAVDVDLAVRLPGGTSWTLAAILFLTEPGATGAHVVNIKSLFDDNISVSFTAGDSNARLEPYLPVEHSRVLRVSDTGAGSGNILVAFRFEPARW